jgi:hypothetical protein
VIDLVPEVKGEDLTVQRQVFRIAARWFPNWPYQKGGTTMITTELRNRLLLNILAAMSSVSWLTYRTATVVAAPSDESPSANFVVDRSDLQSPEWLTAIHDATQHQGEKGHYTLLRIKTVGFDSPHPTQLKATKLKELTPIYDGGGGEYRIAKNGDFVLWEHINTAQRRKSQDPIEVGHIESGNATLWFDAPAHGKLNVLGDIVVRPAPQNERGRLEISIEKDAATNTTAAVIGPIVVGGQYGTKYSLSAEGKSESITLAPGHYKIVFPDFDPRKSRWDFTIRPGMTTRLKLKAITQKQLDLVEEGHL